MPVPNSMSDLATIAGSNSPAGTEPIGNSLDDYIRSLSAIIRSTNAISASTIASASTTDIASSSGESVTITGTATINSLGSGFPGCVREVYFAGSLTINHSASLVMPRASNTAIAAGDTAVFRCVSSGVWRYVGGSLSNPNFANITGTSISDSTGDLRSGAGGLNSRLPLSGGNMTGPIRVNASSGANQFIWRSADGSANRFFTSSDEFSIFFNSLNDSGAYNGQILRLSRTSLDVTVGGNITSNSDERLKRDWTDIPDDLVDRLADVKAGDYERIDTGKRQTGVGAQSIEGVMPLVVSEDEGVKSVAYGNAALVGVIALCRRVKELEALAGFR